MFIIIERGTTYSSILGQSFDDFNGRGGSGVNYRVVSKNRNGAVDITTTSRAWTTSSGRF